MATKRGRPRGATGKAKAAIMHIRVDLLEQEGFDRAADLAGLTTSAWVRERLRRVCCIELKAHGERVPFLPSKKENGKR
jgi:hypothetical protein